MAEILYNEIYPKGATTKNIVAKSKDVKYAKAGTTIVYDTFEEYTYGIPVITVEYKTVLSRNGGSIKPTVTYSQTRTKRGFSERAYESETISGTVESFTASGKILNSSEATIDTSNGTVSRDSLGTTYKSATWNIMEVTVTAAINGVSASGTGIAKMQSNTYTDSGGVTTYSNVIKGSITHGYIPASGGEATATATAGSQNWYTSEVVRTFQTNSTKVITPAKSGTNTINGTTLTVSKNSKGTDISKVTVAGTKTVTWAGQGNKSATGTLYVYQNANYVTELTLSGGGLAYDTFTAAGTTKTPKTSTSKTVTFKFTSGSTTTTVPSSTYGSLSRAVSYGMTTATGFTLNSSSTGSITASNNKSTSARSTTAYRYEKATWTPSSSYPDADTINSSQGSNSCTVSQSKGYYSYSSWSVSISASPTSGISAKGGSSTVTASASRTYGWNGATSGVGTQSGTIKLSIPSAVSGSSLSGTASGSTLTWNANYSTSARGVIVRATCQENTSVYKEVTITQNGDTKSSTTTEYSVSISANRYTSSSSSCPAAGGSATLTYSGSTREKYNWVSGDVTYSEWVAATPEISGSATGFTRDGTSVTISSQGVGAKNARSVTYTAKVGTASKSVTIYQQANAVTSTAYKFSTFSLSKTSFTAAGGTATLSMIVQRQYTYTSTSKGDWTTITPSSGTLSVSAGTGGSVGSISYGSTSTCTITVAAYTNTSSNRTIGISGNYNSGSATASASITQTKDAISSYGNVTAGSLSYSISGDIPASGGTVTITPSAGSQPVYWVSGRETSQTVSAPSSQSIHGGNLGTSEKSRTSLGTKTFTWAGSGSKTASVTSKTIYQQANTITDSDYNSKNGDYWASCDIGTGITAGGGSATVSKSAGHTHYYQQKYTSNEVAPSSTTYYNYSVSDSCTIKITTNGNSRFTLDGTTLKHSPMGTSETTDTCTITCTNSSYTSATGTDTISVTNKVTDTDYNSSNYDFWASCSIGSGITAAGGSATVTKSAGHTHKYYYLYTSGSTSAAKYSYPSDSCTIKITSNGNNRFSLSGTTLSHTTMGTSATTDSCTITCTNSSATSATGTDSVSVSNAITNTSYGSWSYNWTTSNNSTRTRTITYTYTSKKTSTSSETETGGTRYIVLSKEKGSTPVHTFGANGSGSVTMTTYSHDYWEGTFIVLNIITGVSCTCSGFTCSVSGSTLTITASNLGTTITNAKSAMVVSSKTGFVTRQYTCIAQDGNYVTAVSPQVINSSYNHFYYSGSVAASGGYKDPIGNGASTLTFSSGSTYYSSNAGSHCGGNISYSRSYSLPTTTGASINSSGRVTWEANTSTSRRDATVSSTLTVTFTHPSGINNGKAVSGTLNGTATCSQNADSIVSYNTPTFDMWWSSGAGNYGTPVSAAGGTSSAPVYPVSQTANYASGQTKSVTPNITSAVFSLNGSTTVSTVSVNSSTGVVTFGSTGTSLQNKEHAEILLTLVSHGKTGKDTGWCHQAANYVTDKKELTNVSVSYANASYIGGVNIAPSKSATYKVTPTYTSGASGTTTTSTVIPNIDSYSITGTGCSKGSTIGYIIWDSNPNTASRSATITGTVAHQGITSSFSTTAWQAAKPANTQGCDVTFVNNTSCVAQITFTNCQTSFVSIPPNSTQYYTLIKAQGVSGSAIYASVSTPGTCTLKLSRTSFYCMSPHTSITCNITSI